MVTICKTKKYGWVAPYASDINKEKKSVKFFIRGEGWKKETYSEIKEIEPLKSNSKIEICKVAEDYGEYVTKELMERVVCGYMVGRLFSIYQEEYRRVKPFLDETTIPLFELHSGDTRMATLGIYMYDIIKLDKKLSELDKDYDDVKCTYKGEKISLQNYIQIKFGDNGVKMIEALIK